MSGRDAIRGFAIQALLCFMDALDGANAGWTAVTVEPDSDNEKVDILWEYPGYLKAQQVKSSRNVMGRTAIEGWCADLAASKGADRYELLLAGPVAGGVIAAAPFSGVQVPQPAHVDVVALTEQAVTRLDRYLTDRSLDPVPLGIREALVTLLAGRLMEGASAGRRWERVAFDGLLLRWIVAAYPRAIQHRLQANCEVLWSGATLVAPRRSEARAFDVVVPLAVVNGGPAVAVVEWFALRIASHDGGASLLYRPTGVVRDPGALAGSDGRAVLAEAEGFGECAIMPDGVRELAVLFTLDTRSGDPNAFWPLGTLDFAVHVKYRGQIAPIKTKSVEFLSEKDHRAALSGSRLVRLYFSQVEL